jgi:glycosyltransferase involved in cell wall biosynthesis
MLFTRFLISVLPRCAGVITVSQPIAQEIQRRYRVPKVSLLRNVPTYQKIARSDRLRQTLGLGPDVRIALYQGSLQFRRGLDQLILAASFLEPDIVIVLLGPAPEETLPEIEALIASEGVADRIKILPPVPYEELLEWTASADIGLILYAPDYSLNTRMCLPNKFFEYLMAGLPVLSSRLDAVGEVITAYGVGQIVSSLTSEDIGAAINAILADQAALDRMHCNALKVAEQEFCWEREKAGLIHLYQDILAERKRERRADRNSKSIQHSARGLRG